MRVRSLHKWIGIVIGLALLMWTVTGIIMVLPVERRRDAETRPLPVELATVSPAAAIARLTGDSSPAIRSIALVRVLDRAVYQVTARRRTFLLDASTGEPFEITPQVAEAIARAGFRGTPGDLTVERLEGYDGRYASGHLPAYRVTMGDAASTVSYVSGLDGSIVTGDSRRRFRAVVGRLHDFSALRVLVPSDWFHRGLAIAACLASIAGLVTGYWLALPPRRAAPRGRVTRPMTVGGKQ